METKKVLNLFLQCRQVDAESTANIPPQMVQVLEWKPRFKKNGNENIPKQKVSIIAVIVGSVP